MNLRLHLIVLLSVCTCCLSRNDLNQQYILFIFVLEMSYERDQERLLLLLDNWESEEEEEVDDIDQDPNYEVNVGNPLIPNEDSDMEIEDTPAEFEEDSDSDEEGLPEEIAEQIFVGRNKNMNYKWNKNQPPPRRSLLHNIFTEQRSFGPNKTISSAETAIQLFKRYITPEMCSIIVRETNRKAAQSYQDWNNKYPGSKQVWKILNENELYAYIGILIFAGVSRSNCEHTKELWALNANPLYRATMGLRRFWSITQYIRFDNQNTRAQRLIENKAAPIADLFAMLNANLKSNYKPSVSLTVDEQLFPYRGRTKFTQYIPSKPAKYGIKVWWVCDSITSYPLTGQIYTGKPVGGSRDINQGRRIVNDLCSQFKNTGRTITCDNFFTSIPLAKDLLDMNLAVIGTLKKNKPEVPIEFLPSPNRTIHSSLFGFADKMTICSYVPKKNKAVVMLSTVHYDKVTSGTQHKPEIILNYNKTKGGVDNFDKMLGEYTTKRRTQRWPLAFFYNIIDIGAFASFVLYKCLHPTNTKSTSARRTFLKELANQLVKPAIEERANNSHVNRVFSTKNALEAMTNATMRINKPGTSTFQHERDSSGRIKQKGKCHLCTVRRPTRKCCATCKKPVCSEHSEDFCICNECEK